MTPAAYIVRVQNVRGQLVASEEFDDPEMAKTYAERVLEQPGTFYGATLYARVMIISPVSRGAVRFTPAMPELPAPTDDEKGEKKA